MSEKPPAYPFFSDLARIINSGQSRSVILYGNIHDLYYARGGSDQGRYVPLIDFLSEKCQVKGHVLLVYEQNGPIRIVASGDRDKLRAAWVSWKLGLDTDQLVLAG